MAQDLRRLAALPEDSATPLLLTTVSNSSYWGSNPSTGLFGHQEHKWCTDIHADKICIHTKITVIWWGGSDRQLKLSWLRAVLKTAGRD